MSMKSLLATSEMARQTESVGLVFATWIFYGLLDTAKETVAGDLVSGWPWSKGCQAWNNVLVSMRVIRKAA